MSLALLHHTIGAAAWTTAVMSPRHERLGATPVWLGDYPGQATVMSVDNAWSVTGAVRSARITATILSRARALPHHAPVTPVAYPVLTINSYTRSPMGVRHSTLQDRWNNLSGEASTT